MSLPSSFYSILSINFENKLIQNKVESIKIKIKKDFIWIFHFLKTTLQQLVWDDLIFPLLYLCYKIESPSPPVE